jgi:hypothetical protein
MRGRESLGLLAVRALARFVALLFTWFALSVVFASQAIASNAVAPPSSSTQLVKIGKYSKLSTGVVTEINSGDAACYVSLKNDKGNVFDESADFTFCEKPKTWVGKRVTLGYTLGRVMADECGGDPNCKKSVEVAIINKMTVVDAKTEPKLDAKASSPAATPVARSAARGQASFCTPLEVVVFACRTGGKMISVCAAKDATRNKGYLQYRFGKPDSSEPLELMLPEGHLIAAKAATGENVPFAGGGGSWLRFRKGNYGYVVYEGIGRWGARGETQEKAGLVVERDGKQIANLKCSAAPISELGPQWYESTGVKLGRNEEFLFPD